MGDDPPHWQVPGVISAQDYQAEHGETTKASDG